MNGHKKGIKNFPQTFFTALSGLPLGLPPEPPLESPLRLSLGLLLEAVAKCIGHTISCTDIAVIRTGYRISRLFCDNPISYLSNALPHLPTDSAQGGYPSAISSRPSWLCSPGIAKRSSGRSLRCPKQRNRKASGRSRTGRSFSRSDSRSAPRNRAGSLAAQSSADR